MAKRVVLAPGALVIIPQLSVPPSQLQAVFLVDQGVRFVFGLLAILPICEAFVNEVSIHFPSPLSLLISERNKSLRQGLFLHLRHFVALVGLKKWPENKTLVRIPINGTVVWTLSN